MAARKKVEQPKKVPCSVCKRMTVPYCPKHEFMAELVRSMGAIDELVAAIRKQEAKKVRRGR